MNLVLGDCCIAWMLVQPIEKLFFQDPFDHRLHHFRTRPRDSCFHAQSWDEKKSSGGHSLLSENDCWGCVVDG